MAEMNLRPWQEYVSPEDRGFMEFMSAKELFRFLSDHRKFDPNFRNVIEDDTHK